MALDPYSLDLLVRTMYGEAASEGPEGQAAVGHVILNRLRQGDRYGGQTVRDVVMAPKQFEPWGNPTARERMMALDPASERYQQLAQIAQGVAAGEIPDPTAGATHFANEAIVRQRRGGKVAPWMDAMSGSARKIGNHTFYGGGDAAVPSSGLPPGTPTQPTPPDWSQQFKSGSPPPPPDWAQQMPQPQMPAAPPTDVAAAPGIFDKLSGDKLSGILGMLGQQDQSSQQAVQANQQAVMQGQAARQQYAAQRQPLLTAILQQWSGRF